MHIRPYILEHPGVYPTAPLEDGEFFGVQKAIYEDINPRLLAEVDRESSIRRHTKNL